MSSKNTPFKSGLTGWVGLFAKTLSVTGGFVADRAQKGSARIKPVTTLSARRLIITELNAAMGAFMDGDLKFPTICGTGTEDYFCGSYNFEHPVTHKYAEFSTPYSGLVQVLPPDKVYEVGQRFGLYRWHIQDPIRFDKDLKVTIQALGWDKNGHYLLETDTIHSVAYWYQTEPHQPFNK